MEGEMSMGKEGDGLTLGKEFGLFV